ncbi:MAG TPA: flavin reductase family protein [Candidatus Krumholzibacteria bacterium]|nr:flavin reductase family protein [Candidatus Krumholzibacteria bacterium]HRX51422.1 flavin reductase family protein [Candidatus Krumholzibacteria bacterium]
MPLSKDETQGVGRIPSGLFIVCARNDDGIDGYLASFIQQVSFDPLLLALAVKPGRPAYDMIKSGAPFSINIVGDHETAYLKHFWSGYDPAKNPFAEIDHTLEDDGTVTLDGAQSVIQAKLHSVAQPGDHEVVFAQVLGSRVLAPDAKPKTHLRKSGLDY